MASCELRSFSCLDDHYPHRREWARSRELNDDSTQLGGQCTLRIGSQQRVLSSGEATAEIVRAVTAPI